MKEIIIFLFALIALLTSGGQEQVIDSPEPVTALVEQALQVQPAVLDSPQPIRPEPTAYPIPIYIPPTLAVIYITVGPPNPTPSGTPEPAIPYPTGISIMTRIANPTIEGK